MRLQGCGQRTYMQQMFTHVIDRGFYSLKVISPHIVGICGEMSIIIVIIVIIIIIIIADACG
jgi:hypothetical protein